MVAHFRSDPPCFTLGVAAPTELTTQPSTTTSDPKDRLQQFLRAISTFYTAQGDLIADTTTLSARSPVQSQLHDTFTPTFDLLSRQEIAGMVEYGV